MKVLLLLLSVLEVTVWQVKSTVHDFQDRMF